MFRYSLILTNVSPLHFGDSIMQTDSGQHLRNDKKKKKKKQKNQNICPQHLGLETYCEPTCTMTLLYALFYTKFLCS